MSKKTKTADLICMNCYKPHDKADGIDCPECKQQFCDNCYDTGKGDGCHCHGKIEVEDVYRRINAGYYENKKQYVPFDKRSQEVTTYVNAVNAYANESARLNEEFKKNALEAVGLTQHPKADKIYGYAWEEGHSAGFSEVFSVLQDMAYLFKD